MTLNLWPGTVITRHGNARYDGSPGYTWSTGNRYVADFVAVTLGQRVHSRRIDYIFVGSPLRWRPRVVVESCSVVLNSPEDPASDHYAVMADLSVVSGSD